MRLIKLTLGGFSRDRCTTLAAALSYYTAFALPPLLFLLVTLISTGFSLAYDTDHARDQAEQLIYDQAADVLENETAKSGIASMLENMDQQTGTGWKTLLSLGGVLIGATGVVVAMQDALNQVWDVKPDPRTSGVTSILLNRLLSLAMILGLAFLIFVSMAVSSAVAVLGQEIGRLLDMKATTLEILDYTVQFVLLFVVFTLILKLMPDVVLRWRDVAVGGLATTLLFLLGRFVLSVYLGFADPAARLGTATASLAVLLIWVYYSSLIFLFGAELTRAYCLVYGEGAKSKKHAVAVKQVVASNLRHST